jgi:hypothetical protein
MCIDCGEFAEFGPDLTLGPLSEGTLELIDLTEVQAARRIRARWLEYKATATPP